MVGKFVDIDITDVFSNSLRGNVIRKEEDMDLRSSMTPESILGSRTGKTDDLGVGQFQP